MSPSCCGIACLQDWLMAKVSYDRLFLHILYNLTRGSDTYCWGPRNDLLLPMSNAKNSMAGAHANEAETPNLGFWAGCYCQFIVKNSSIS